MAKKINDELYSAYKQWTEMEKRVTMLYLAFEQLAIEHNGTDDRLIQGQLIVELARKRMAENKELSNSSFTNKEKKDHIYISKKEE